MALQRNSGAMPFLMTKAAAIRAYWNYGMQWGRIRGAGQRRLPSGGETAKPHVLLVSWAFPPAHQSSAHLPKALAQASMALSLDLSVVAAPAPAMPTAQGQEMFSKLPPGLPVWRVAGAVDAHNNPATRPPYKFLPGLDGGFDTAAAMADEAIRCLANRPPTVVLAAGPRFSNFVAAYLIARWARARLVLLYMDEWCVQTPPFVSVSPNDRRWEVRCLAAADAVCYVTPGKRAAYEEAYPFLLAKPAHEVPNGWDPDPFALARPATAHLQAHADRFCISFVGTAADHAPIYPFLDDLASVFERRPDLVGTIRVLLVGKQPASVVAAVERFTAAYPDGVRLLPAVAQSEAIEIMRESDALLLLNTTRYSGVVTQKTYDYLNVATPVLAYGAVSGAARLVEEAGAGPVIYRPGSGELESAIDLVRSTPVSHWDTTQRKSMAAALDREALARRCLEFVVGRSPERKDL